MIGRKSTFPFNYGLITAAREKTHARLIDKKFTVM